MLKEHWRTISRLERIGDLAIVLVAFIAAYVGRPALIVWNHYLSLGIPFGGEALAPLKDYAIVLLVALLGYGVLLDAFGTYHSMRLSSHWFLLRRFLVISFIVFMLLAATLFLLKIDLSRSFIALFCGMSALALVAERFIVLRVLQFWRSKGKNFRNVVICGIGEQAVRIAIELGRHPELGLRVVRFAVLGPPSPEDEENFRRSILRTPSRDRRLVRGVDGVEELMKAKAIDEVIFTDCVDVMPMVEELIHLCSEQGVRTTVVADLFSIGLVKSGMSYFAGMPLIHYQTPPGDRWELTVKRGLDVVLSAVLLLALSPLLLLIACMIRLTSTGPVLFRQRRMGLQGRLFTLYKFRTMVVGAHRELSRLRERNEMRGPAFKLADDPRVTRVGRFLRRFSLDELPQLWNVLVGDMSLVGPRPPLPDEVQQYDRKWRRRLSMRPGLTCVWQVQGRNEIANFADWVELDLEYIDNWSLVRDFELMMRTIPVVIFGTGAR